MILPLFVGYLTGRLYGKDVKAVIISLLIGAIMGVFSGLELIPFAYPIYAARPLDWMGLPEYRPIAIYLVFPNFKLYQEVVLMTEFSSFIIVVFTLICVLGILIGLAIGNRTFTKKSGLWSTERNA
jgi:hypothetical protein